jgi:hypothetical protein
MVEVKNGLIQSMGTMFPIHVIYPHILHRSSAQTAISPGFDGRYGASDGYSAPIMRISLIHQYHQ